MWHLPSAAMKLLAAVPTFALATLMLTHYLGDGDVSLDKIKDRNIWYFFTGITSLIMTLFHLWLFVSSFFKFSGWWSWRYPDLCIDEKTGIISFWTYDYAWSFFWCLQLVTEASLPVDHRAEDLGITAAIAGIYVLQTATCVPVLYAAYTDLQRDVTAHPDHKAPTAPHSWLSLLTLGSLRAKATPLIQTRDTSCR
jgi:hypothetical protein